MNYNNYNDYELVYMVRENDESSYDVLFQKYYPVIENIAMECYQGFSSYGYDYEDFLQEGYYAFQKALASYDEKKDALFYTYVSICVRRKLYSFCRKVSCQKNYNSLLCDDVDENPILDSSYDPSLIFPFHEFWYELWNLIYSYPDEYAWVFELRINGFSYSEIEKLLEIPARRAQAIMSILQKKIKSFYQFTN